LHEKALDPLMRGDYTGNCNNSLEISKKSHGFIIKALFSMNGYPSKEKAFDPGEESSCPTCG
jgi:hypothetical protein